MNIPSQSKHTSDDAAGGVGTVTQSLPTHQEEDVKLIIPDQPIDRQPHVPNAGAVPPTDSGAGKKKEDVQPQKKEKIRNDDMDFDQGYSFLPRILFLHLVSMATKIKLAILHHISLDITMIPKIKDDHKVEHTTDIFYKQLTDLQAASNLTDIGVFKKASGLYTMEVVKVVAMIVCDASCKLFNSIALNQCIQEMINKNSSGAYYWGIGVIAAMVVSSTFRHQSWLLGQNIFCRVRLLLVNVIYRKISRLSSYQIKEANLGKVINLISSDLNSTEMSGYFLCNMIVGPFVFIGACIILYFRLGWYGLLSVALLFLVFPMQNFLGKQSAYHINNRVQDSDKRVKLINEAIEGIRLIKMYGWEQAFRQMVEKIRNNEVNSSMRSSNYSQIEKAFSKCYVVVVIVIVFCIINYAGEPLNSAKLFSTIEMLQYIRVNVILFTGFGIGYIFQLKIFLRRFMDILTIEETNSDVTHSSEGLLDDEAIRFDCFSAFWKKPSKKQTKEQQLDEVTKPVLKDLQLSVKKGELLGVVGKIGSGKSSLLQCILGEVPSQIGEMRIAKPKEGRQLLAYVEQEPYIFSSTVRENILFGKPFDEPWYNQVVDRCCLLQDFEEMGKGDMTEIGERGINISGGQKARISLARAVYSNADVYLLDDPLSAVDSKVAKLIFSRCIRGILKDKTIILVTHQINYTQKCDRIVLLEEGVIKQQGDFNQLEEELKRLAAGQLKFETHSQSNKSQGTGENGSKQDKNEGKKDGEAVDEEKVKEAANKLVEKKVADNVVVTSKSYTRLIGIINKVFPGYPVLVLFTFIISEVFFTAFNRGLGYYDTTSEEDKGKLFGFLFAMAFGFLLFNILKYIILADGILLGSKVLHNQMFKSLTLAPVVYFDNTAGGYLMNKFSNDISIIDNSLQMSANDAFDIFFYFCNLIITCCVINPYIIILAAVEITCLLVLFKFSKQIIVQTKILDLKYKSPVFQFFQSTLQGVVPIKIYNQKEMFLKRMALMCDNNSQTNIVFWLAGRFFGVFTQAIAICGSGIGIFIIISLSQSNPGLAGQSLTYFMIMTDSIQWGLRQFINLDSAMSSTERAYQMIDQPSEAPLRTFYDREAKLITNDEFNSEQEMAETTIAQPAAKKEGKEKMETPSNIWPQKGDLKFKQVVMRYSENLQPVLKGVDFEIRQGQKVGCVGRTGAGKSSILQALFRMTESEGSSEIIYDGQNVSKLGLHTLRQKISIIPQVPFVFAGTIRRNLDPLDHHTEDELWNVLKLVELDQYIVKNHPKQLDTDMTNAQNVFSVGQKQLICLARAILKKNKLLVLDEATANVDMETDNLIQKTIRDHFKDSSVLTIAHRLNTIADYDRVIVMNEGKVAEYDEPFKLLVKSTSDEEITSDSLFAQMVKHTGKNNAANIFSNAKAKFQEMHNQDEF